MFRWIGFLTVTFGVVGVLLLGGGFVWFERHVPRHEIKLDRKADGIVVLTGAASRIADAIELLAVQRGKRLLITGVYHATSAREIARITPLYSRYFTCCIDIDRSALNTLGNAYETKRWVRHYDFKSLIVVTSNWHMPRAMIELRHQLPEVELISYPVVADKNPGPWWSNPNSTRLLISEYLKYLYALARMQLDPNAA
jgi:uncharacterized SAM-binding protein YcdF (DUF218 family)